MKTAFSICLGLLLIGISSCKKDVEIVPQAFSLQGTWRINVCSLDSRGKLYQSPFNLIYMQFYGDSVTQFSSNGERRRRYGKFIISDKDSSVALDRVDLKNEVILGKNLQCYFTKETYFYNDGKQITLQKLAQRGDILHVVNRDSIFAFSYCCTAMFSMVRE